MSKFFFKIKEEKFDIEKWFQNRECRYKLITDLIESKILLGLTKQEVLDFLGYEFNDMNSQKWSYYIGGASGLCFYKKSKLYIVFNKKDIVIHLKIG